LLVDISIMILEEYSPLLVGISIMIL